MKNITYDAMGQRIAKTVTNKNVTTGDKFVTTYYVRDPQGNVLAVYEHKHGDSDNGTFTLAEQHLYGASRLGMKKRDLALNVANASEPTPPVTHYELTNHLGNVMAVISDKASDTNEPTVVSFSDYYPYGMEMPKRAYNLDYRFGYTGHEKEDDLASGVYTTEYRLLDTRLDRWMSVDPLYMKYPGMSSYNYCGGNPLVFWNPVGKEVITSMDTTGTHDPRVDSNKRLVEFYSEYPDNAPNIISLSMHGSSSGMTPATGSRDRLDSPDKVKRFLIKYSSVYNRNNPVEVDPKTNKSSRVCKKPSVLVLLSCSTGAGEGCIAQQISQTDEIPLVIAPSKTLWCTTGGDETYNDHHQEVYKENKRKFKEPGSWVVYYKGVAVDYISGGTWFFGLFGNAVQIKDWLKENNDPEKLIEKYQKVYDRKQKQKEIQEFIDSHSQFMDDIDMTD